MTLLLLSVTNVHKFQKCTAMAYKHMPTIPRSVEEVHQR